MFFRVSDDAVVLLAAGITLEFIQGEYLRQRLGIMIYASEITHSRHSGYIVLKADLLGGHGIFKGADGLGDQAAGNTVIAGQEGNVLKEPLAAAAAVSALSEVQESLPFRYRKVFYDLYAIVMHKVRRGSTGGTGMCFPGKLKIDMERLGGIFYIRDIYIFQIQKFCGIILTEHGGSPFVVIGGAFIIKDFSSMLNPKFTFGAR